MLFIGLCLLIYIVIVMHANRLDVGDGLYLAVTSVHSYDPPHYIRREGSGMYTSFRLRAGTCLGEMVGVVMAGELYQRRRLQGLGGYGIALSRGRVLCCRESFFEGRCLMSHLCHPAGGFVDRVDIATGVIVYIPARANCVYRVSGDRVSVYTTRDIRPLEEMLVSVGTGGLRYLGGPGPL